MSSSALIVFTKNPVLGKVKTRLARTIGAKQALSVYQKLLIHTNAVCKNVNAERFVFYSDFIAVADEWTTCTKRAQVVGDLGTKMQAAFNEVLNEGFQKVVIVGSDCLAITTTIIEAAFSMLNEHDVVIGPATDGGYYLLGMKQLHPILFENKNWSTDKVLQQTLADVNDLQLNYFLLPVLNDIDEEKDLAGTQLLEP